MLKLNILAKGNEPLLDNAGCFIFFHSRALWGQLKLYRLHLVQGVSFYGPATVGWFHKMAD